MTDEYCVLVEYGENQNDNIYGDDNDKYTNELIDLVYGRIVCV